MTKAKGLRQSDTVLGPGEWAAAWAKFGNRKGRRAAGCRGRVNPVTEFQRRRDEAQKAKETE